MRTFRIFLSSPGDCEAERAAAFTIIEQLNADPLITQFARLEVVAWDWGAGVPFDALASPQVSVNDRMPVPEACDVYIGIFRSRFGSRFQPTSFVKTTARHFYREASTNLTEPGRPDAWVEKHQKSMSIDCAVLPRPQVMQNSYVD